MNDAKHTPGPWKIWRERDTQTEFCICVGIEGVRLASLPDMRVIGENEANACLIAAAPDLLEACKAAWAELDNRYDVDVPEPGHSKEYPFNGAGELMRRLQAAIRKAEGR